ncbi:hypothetical protein Dimus_023571 [Dionaea muscipula]
MDTCPTIWTCQTVHAQVIKSRFINDGFIGDRLVSLYVKWDHDEEARKLFDEIPLKDLVSWNSLISSFSRKGGCLGVCLSLFSRMRNKMGLEPNDVTLISIVTACVGVGAIDKGRFIHGLVIKTGNSEEIKVANSLINMYGRIGTLDDASRLIQALHMPNLVSWNSILTAYAQNGLYNDVFRLFGSMRRAAGIEPDQATMVSLLYQGSCSEMGSAKQAEAAHSFTFKCGFVAADTLVMTSLLMSYSKSGRLGAAKLVFMEMNDRRDGVAWTAMLAAYAVHGCGKEAIELFEAMVNEEGIAVDHVTFTHLLSACSHSGLVVEGREYFNNMSKAYGVEPTLDHYSCMVDLLGRSGAVNEAHGLIKRMPMRPNAGVWGSLLAACRTHKNIELGKEASENLFALDPSDHRNYIMLSNIYSASGQWRAASKIRSLMKQRGLGRGLVRNPGCSLIEHGSNVYRFLVGDQSHPESARIYAKLEEIMERIKKAGFVHKTEFVLHDVDEDVKEDMIKKHSEKLAIAFGLLATTSATTNTQPITIIKNLRICGDCHTMAKLVSFTENRKIIIRDTKRFHHFADGKCSCGDYW